MADRTSRLLDGLPETFSTGNVRTVGKTVGYAPGSAEAAIRRLAQRGVVTRTARGAYAKAPGGNRDARRLEGQWTPLDHRERWIDSNWRVLGQALDPRVPVAERIRLVSTVAQSLDQFMQTRGGARRLARAGAARRGPDGRTADEQARLVGEAVASLWTAMYDAWEVLRSHMDASSAGIVAVGSLGTRARGALDAHFETQLFPLLTPLAVDRRHRFPFVSNLSLSLAIVMRQRGHTRERVARLKVPLRRGRFVPVGSSGAIVAVEDLVCANLNRLFPGMRLLGSWPFRVTRSAVAEKGTHPAVRLEVDEAMPEHVQQLLLRELELEPAHVWVAASHLDLGGIAELAERTLHNPFDDSSEESASLTRQRS